MKISTGVKALVMVALAAPAAFGAGSALLYQNESAARAGKSRPALSTSAGAVVPADEALASIATLLIGDETGLYKAAVAKLDNDLNVALLRKGERVADEGAQAAHAARWQATAAFAGLSASSAPAAGGVEVVTIAPTIGDAGPFTVKLNDRSPGGAPIVLKKRLNKSKFKFEVVNTSTAAVWMVETKLTAEPELSFWKEGRKSGLNDVPTKELSYTYQAVFKPLKPGAGFTVPVEAYFIKSVDYVLTLKIDSKAGAMETKIPVRFE